MQFAGKVVFVLMALLLSLLYLIRIVREHHRYGHALSRNKWKLALTFLIPALMYLVAFRGSSFHIPHNTRTDDQSVIHASVKKHISPQQSKQDQRAATQKKAQEASQANIDAINHGGVTNQDKGLALSQAQNYLTSMGISQAALYQQLTSSYGAGLSPRVAQYAVDNVHVDWNQEALRVAQDYQSNQNLSGIDLYDQLTSQDADQFTPEQAQYAVKHV